MKTLITLMRLTPFGYLEIFNGIINSTAISAIISNLHSSFQEHNRIWSGILLLTVGTPRFGN